jgi:hypothetical protein
VPICYTWAMQRKQGVGNFAWSVASIDGFGLVRDSEDLCTHAQKFLY